MDYNKRKKEINNILEEGKIYANRRKEIRDTVTFFDEDDENFIATSLICKISDIYILMKNAIDKEDYEFCNSLTKYLDILSREFKNIFSNNFKFKLISDKNFFNLINEKFKKKYGFYTKKEKEVNF